MLQHLQKKRTALRHLATCFALVATLLFAPLGLRAQTTVEIGNGANAGYYTPIGTYYNYSITEQLYTSDEIGMAGTITSVSFYWAFTTAKDFNITMYMANVEAANLSTGINLASATEVYSGTLSVPATAGWVTITLDTPFPYDGTSNLLIGINKTGGSSWFSGQTWRYTSVESMARYTQQDGSAYTTSTTPGTTTDNRPNIQLEITPSSGPTCERPADLTVSNITTTGATFSWTSTVGNYVFEYKAASADTWTTLPLTTNTTTLTNLQHSTVYDVRVKALCSADLASGYRTATFNTNCGVLSTFPINYGFETSEGFPSNSNVPTANTLGPCWRNIATVQSGSNATRVWGTSTLNKHAGSQALILPDKGIASNPAKTMLVFPAMNFTNANGYVVSLWVFRNSNGTNPEGFKVYASNTDTIDANAVELGHYSRNYGIAYPQVESASGWYQYETSPIMLTGTVYLIFEGQSYYGNATYVDDISIYETPSCLRPGVITTSNLTAHAATINWTAGGTETYWHVTLTDPYDTVIVDTMVNTPTYTFTGLDGSTQYTASVAAFCGTSESEARTLAFTTPVACPAPTNVTFSNITTTTATVSWTGTASSFSVMLGDSILGTTNTNSYTLTGLTANTSYTVKVKAVCGGIDGESQWTSGTSFMTAEVCPDGMVCIGTGTSTNSYLPTYTYYNYSLTQQIYTAAELGQAGEISSIDFYKNGTTGGTRNLDIYLVSTTKTSFSGATDWITVTAADLVFSGNVTFANDAWTTITFDSPFSYDGTNNIAIIVDDNTGSYVSSPSFRVFDAASQAIRVYSDGTNYDPTAPTSYNGTVLNVKNRIRLAVSAPSACPRPTHLAVNYTGGTSAQVSWTSDATTWNINVNDTVTYGVTANPTTLSGLDLGTNYTIQVQANCGGGDTSEWSNPVSFTTDLCDTTNMCAITLALHDSYGDSWNGGTLAVVDSLTGATIGTYTVADGAADTFVVNVCNGRTVNFVYTAGSYGTENGWVITDINEEVVAEHQGCNSGCAVSNGVVGTYTVDCTVTNCRRPADLAATEVGPHSAILSWTETGQATSWVVAYAPAGDTTFTEVAAATNPYTLTGLNPETAYTVEVRPVCDDSSIKWSSTIDFTTNVPCPVPTNLAITPAVNTAEVIWNGFAASYDLQWAEVVTYAHWLQYDNNIVATNMGSDSVQDWTWGVMYPSTMFNGTPHLTKVGVFENSSNWTMSSYTVNIYTGGDNAPGTLVHTETVTPSGSYGIHEIVFASPVTIDTTQNLWITVTANGTYVVVACESTEPNNGWIYMGGAWTNIANYTSDNRGWMIRGYVDNLDATIDWNTETVVTSPYTLTGLTAETSYIARMKSTCGTDGVSDWTSIISFTTHAVCDVPNTLTAGNITPTTADLGWTGYQESYNVRWWIPADANFDTAEYTQVGTDYTAQDTLVTYTIDLSAYSGLGNIAIRHYNVSDMFRLNVDDIVVTNAQNQVVLSEDFESGQLNSGWFNVDVDADGYNWFIWNITQTDNNGNPLGNGSYCATSASYNQSSGALTPDNWLVIPNVELGGTLTFVARGQDPSWAEEVFGIYVSTTAATTTPVAVNGVNAPYNVTGLTPATNYVFQVQGVSSLCDGGVTEWSTVGSFTTPGYPKAIEANKWYAITSPTHNDGVNETLAGVTNLTSGSHDLYRYNEADGVWENYKAHTTDFTTLEQGRGYIYRRANNDTLTFNGKANTGVISYPLSYGCTDDDLLGFNLVGNPYMQAATPGRLCYSLTPTGLWYAQPATYQASISEAVLVKASTDDESVSFTTSSGAKGNTSMPALAFTVSNSEYEDIAYAMLDEGDGLPKIGHLNSEAPMLSIPMNGRRYAIAMVGNDCETFNMVFRGTAGEYTLAFDARHANLNYCHLIDRATGKDIDLLQTPEYTFSATGNDADRFMVKLTPDAVESAIGNFAYWNGNAWVVEGEGTLQVFDVVGRRIASHEVDSQLSILNSQFPSTGVYILRLGEKSQKIVVK